MNSIKSINKLCSLPFSKPLFCLSLFLLLELKSNTSSWNYYKKPLFQALIQQKSEHEHFSYEQFKLDMKELACQTQETLQRVYKGPSEKLTNRLNTWK